MARGDTLDFEVLGCVAGEFEDFGSEVFEDCGYVDGGWDIMLACAGRSERGSRLTLCAYAHLVLGVVLEETLDSTARELWE